MSSVEEFIERYPTVKKVMIDGRERPIARSKDQERQKSNYSGKKKRHTRKHIAAVDDKNKVLILSKAREGKVHDMCAHDEDDIVGSIPEEIPVEADSGFLGLQKQYIAFSSLMKCNNNNE
ncbi:MAG: transposase family protein [Cyanobacteria bacterium J06621_8]